MANKLQESAALGDGLYSGGTRAELTRAKRFTRAKWIPGKVLSSALPGQLDSGRVYWGILLTRASLPWYRGTMVQWYRRTMVPWYHMVPLYHCTMVSCYHGTIVPWYHGTMAPCLLPRQLAYLGDNQTFFPTWEMCLPESPVFYPGAGTIRRPRNLSSNDG